MRKTITVAALFAAFILPFADGMAYCYASASVNGASPAQSHTLAGSFTTRASGSPELTVRATPGLETSTVSVTVKTPGVGSSVCDVYIARGADPDNLDAEELIGDDVGIGAVCTKTIASPTTPYLTYYTVRVVNPEGHETTVSGSFDTEIKWHFDAKNNRLTNSVGWKVAASRTIYNGVEGYSIDGADAIKAAPKDAGGAYLTELDLTGLKDTGLDIIALGSYIFRDNGGLGISLTKLHLPDTIMKISDCSFVSTSTILDFEPHEFPNLVKHGNQQGIPNALFTNPVLSFPNPGYQHYPQQMWQASGSKRIYFGTGLTSFGNYAFDASGATDVYLSGEAVPTTGSSWHRGTNLIRINVPIYSDEWKAYAEASAADPTAAQRTTYAAAFTDGRELWKIGSSGKTPDYGGLYLCKWAPDDYCRNAIHVRGSMPAGEVVPCYGKHKYVAQSITCTAPLSATYEGVEYLCTGYVLEALGDDGWGAPATNLNVASFTLDRDGETTYRLTWLWEEAGFTLALNTAPPFPPSGLTYGEISVSPASTGHYAPGTTVTLEAPATGSGGWTDARFDYWLGDVPEGHEKDNPLVVTMNQARSLTPVYTANWRAVAGYETTRITDGYFTLKCSTTDNEITLDSSCGVVAGGGADVLDLRKPVADGRIITTLKGYTFSPNVVGKTFPFETIIFPDTLKCVSSAQVGGGMFGSTGVKKLVNIFPNSLTNFTGGMHGISAVWEGDPVCLLNKKLTTVPSQIFGGYSGGHTYHLGVNIVKISDYAFDGWSGGGCLSVYLHGETKPTFGGNWNRSVSPVRVVVPRSSAEWKSWFASNLNVPSAAQTNIYDTIFADREPGEKLVGIGKDVDKLNGVYFCTWPSPEAQSRMTIIILR